MLRCSGCGDVVSEWADRCPACGHATEDAVPDPEITAAPETNAEPEPDSGPQPEAVPEPVGPEPDPGRFRRPKRKHILIVMGAAVVIYGGTIGGLTLTSGSTSPSLVNGYNRYVATLPGTVVSLGPGGTLEESAPDGQSAITVPNLQFSLVNPNAVVASPSGRYLVTQLGGLIAIDAGQLATFPTPLRGSSMTSVATGTNAFADHEQALLTVTPGPTINSAEISVLSLDGRQEFGLGMGDDEAADPQSLGAYVSVASPSQPRTAPPGGLAGHSDSRLELRQPGRVPQVLATATELNLDVGQSLSKPVHLSAFPNPSGDEIAVVVDPISGGTANAPMVILDRAGGVLAVVRATAAPTEYVAPTWSPDGESLAYVTSGPHGTELAVRSGSGRLTTRVVPDTGDVYQGCIWSPTGLQVLCGSSSGSSSVSEWLLGNAAGGPTYLVHVIGAPILWMPQAINAEVAAILAEPPAPTPSLPEPGSAGYPVSVYPPDIIIQDNAVPFVGDCPNPAGLQLPGPSARSTATAIVSKFGSEGLTEDLRATDPALWSQVLNNWQNGNQNAAENPVPVLFAGLLSQAHLTNLLQDVDVWLQSSCGASTAAQSYLLVAGTPSAPALQEAYVFIQRAGHLLLYFEYP